MAGKLNSEAAALIFHMAAYLYSFLNMMGQTSQIPISVTNIDSAAPIQFWVAFAILFWRSGLSKQH
jgi:hypothetical protein